MSELRGKNGQQAPWKVDYFGIGNENWGLRGKHEPRYYANEYRRYQSFVRDYNNEIIFKRFAAEHHTKIMSGRKRYWQPVSVELPKNSMDLWMDFLSTIMYIQRGLKSKGSSTEFDEMSGIRH